MYFLMQYGTSEKDRLILEKPDQAELEKLQREGWVIWNISYKIGDL